MNRNRSGVIPGPPEPASQHGLDPGRQHPGAEGLGDVVLGADFKAGDDVRVFTLGGQHDDRHGLGLGVGLQGLRHLQAVQPGQHEVQHDQVECLALQLLQGILAARRQRQLVAFTRQVEADQLQDILFIVYDQNAFFSHEGFVQ
jgi:hypothetical protein